MYAFIVHDGIGTPARLVGALCGSPFPYHHESGAQLKHGVNMFVQKI